MLNDVAHFRTEIEVRAGYLDTDFFLEIEMLYAPVIHSSSEAVEDQLKRMVFNPCKTKVFKIHSMVRGKF